MNGQTLSKLSSRDELIRRCGTSTDDAHIIFNFVRQLDVQIWKKFNQGYVHDYGGSVLQRFSELKYVSFEDSLEQAEFKDKEVHSKIREAALNMKKLGVADRYGLSLKDVMALALYTYDNEDRDFEDNPYRVINKVLSERNMNRFYAIRYVVIRILTALRKLPPYNGKGLLYRAVVNVSKSTTFEDRELSWPAFTSTSASEKSAIDFFESIEVRGEKYIIELRGCFNKGHSIREFSFHPGEEGTQITHYP